MRKVLVASRSFGKVVNTGSEMLEKRGFEVCAIPDTERPLNEDRLMRRLGAENPYALIVGAESISSKVLDATKDLKIVSKHGVGLDNIDTKAATKRGIVVTYTPGTNAQSVADFTVGLMLAMCRKICPANQSTKGGKWEKFVGRELWGKTIGVVGTGNIGREVIKRMSGFETDIVAYDIEPDEAFAAKYGVKYVPLHELLRSADYVTIHVPLTKDTENLISSKELNLMKKTAYLLNTSRGKIVDERALYECLRTEAIAGAALDVFSVEPPLDRELLKPDNVIATPHIGAYTLEAMERMDVLCAQGILELSEGKLPKYAVNREAITR